MLNLKFSIGILSWQGYDSLVNSLITYKKNGLSDMTDYKFICLPEYTKEGIKIAQQFNYEPILIKENLGILGGFKALAEKMPQGPVLLLENDLSLIEKKQKTFCQLQKSIELLSMPRVIQIRLRSRTNPGDPFVALKKYQQYWSDSFISRAKRFCRPSKAEKLIGTSTYLLDYPEKRHPQTIKKLSDGFYLTSSVFLNWSNFAILVDRDKYLDIIIKKAEATKSNKHINGFKNIEIELNNSWWRKQKFEIVVAPGLFSHKRLSYRGY
jgi:hypothetical protein